MNSIKINSLQMGSFYDYELGNRTYLDMGKAVLDYSLFAEFMLANGMKVNNRGKSFDFIMCKFDYGTNDKTGSDIRDMYYTDGFIIDWTNYNYKCNIQVTSKIEDEKEKSDKLTKITSKYDADKKHSVITYKMLMRSTGKAKDGDCLFVNEKLYEDAHSYITIGIKLPEENSRIVEMAAYDTLTCANMIDSIEIPLKNILILEDQKVETLVKAVKVNTKTVQKPIEVVDYRAMEKQANELGFTFYKKNERKEDGYEYIENQKKRNIENLKIKLIYKDTGKKANIPDYESMEVQANYIGYTFYKKNENYKYIRNLKKKDIVALGIIFIEKESDNNAQVFDYKEMELQANELNYTFFKKEANNKDGYELIDRDILVAKDKGIDIITKISKIIDVQECYVERTNEPVTVSNIMWDGMGVIDSSIMRQIPNCSGYVYLRNHMTKVCCFEGEVVQFLKDKYGDEYENATREDMFGNQINVRDILLITTDKAIKWLKFTDLMGENPYEYFDNVLSTYKYKFEVVKTAHKSKYNNLQRMSYQGTNSLPCLDETDLEKIAQSSIDYCNDLKTNDDKFINHIEVTANNYSINNVLADLSRHNENFLKTLYASTERASIISKFKRERLELGKLLQVGDNLTICGNPYALLMYAVGVDCEHWEDWRQDPTLNVIDGAIQCYTTRFNHGDHLAGYRSPQNAPNNYGYYINHHTDLMEKYFPNLSDNVIVINMIGTDSQSRLNGHDMDTDGIYCTNQPEIVKYASRCYKEYPTIINNIPEVTSLSEEERKKYNIVSYSNTLKDYAEMDNAISRYQCGIGWSSNVAQLALSYYWDEYYRSEFKVKNQELENIFIICSCLAQCYIDSAKRTFALDLNREMLRLSRVSCMQREKKYPKFYARIRENKFAIKKNDSDNKKADKKQEIVKINDNIIENCKCPMDMIAKIIKEGVVDLTGTNKNKALHIKDFIIKKDEFDKKKIRDGHKQLIKIEKIIKEYDDEMCKLNSENDDYKEKAMLNTDETIERLDKLSISKENMYKLVRVAFGLDKGKFKKNLCNRILILLYNYDIRNNEKKEPQKFLSLFIKSPQKMLEHA